MIVKRRPRGRLKQCYLFFTDTNLLRHRHNLVQQQRDLQSGSWADISPGHNLALPVQEGPSFPLREGGEHLQHPLHALVHRHRGLQGQTEKHSHVPKARLRSALEQIMAQGLGLSGLSKERPAQGKKRSPSLLPSCASSSGYLPKSSPRAQYVWDCSIHSKLCIPK